MMILDARNVRGSGPAAVPRSRSSILLTAFAAAAIVGCRADAPAEDAGSALVPMSDSTPTISAPADNEPVLEIAADSRTERPAHVGAPTQETLHIFDASPGGPLANVVGGAFTKDELVLAEASTSQLHFYDVRTGAALRTVGRRGGGPGEFQRLEWMQRRGEHLYAYDQELRRLSAFWLDGTYLRSVSVQDAADALRPSPVGVLPDRSIIAYSFLREEGVRHMDPQSSAGKQPTARAEAVRASDIARARALLAPPASTQMDVDAVFDLQSPPERFPAFGWGGKRPRIPPVVGASDGTIWVLRYGGVRTPESVRLKLSSTGELTDSVRMPGESLLLDASGALVLLRTFDSDGADRVLLVRLRSPND